MLKSIQIIVIFDDNYVVFKLVYLMTKSNFLILILFLIFCLGCKSDRSFPEVKNLSTYKATEFAPTLEQKISKNKNSIYCVTLLLAWDEVRKQIEQPIEIPKEYKDLIMLNQSQTFQNSLNEDEYNVSAEIELDKIIVNAAFDKNLPFEIDLKSFNNKLLFEGEKVASFGVNGADSYELLKNIRIIYYKNDANFIIKLFPKEKEHEIIIFKFEKKFGTLIQMNNEIERLTKIGQVEKQIYKSKWKYTFEYEDELVIPKFNFNIKTNYPILEQKRFKAKALSYKVESIWQRTAFILDGSGAKIESEAEIEVAVEEMAIIEEIKKPKKMYLDKPFFIILKRTDSKNPYFALWNANSELMIKE